MIINKPRTLSQKQDYRFASMRIENNGNGMFAVLRFNVYGDKGEYLAQEEVVFIGEDFNSFWSDFTSGKYLYDKFFQLKEIGVSVDDSIELEFRGDSK